MSSHALDAIKSAKRAGAQAGPMVRPPGFTESAACKGSNGSHDAMFFPTREPSPSRLQKIVDMFCGGCPVVAACRSLGRSSGSEGIWGGEWLKGDSAVRDSALKAEVIERVVAGETDGTIARMTNIDVSTVSTWRRAEGLASNVPYGTELRSA